MGSDILGMIAILAVSTLGTCAYAAWTIRSERQHDTRVAVAIKESSQ